VSGGSLLPLPRWTEGVEESTTSHTCDWVWRRRRLWRRVHDLEIVKWTTISTTSSERLRRLRASSSRLHRQRLCGNVIPATGLRWLVSVATISYMFLASFVFMRRKNFVFYEPISGIRAISMRSWYARLEHMEIWALMIMLLLFFCILDHSGIVGFKLPETNITWPRSQDLSHTWYALAYVALRVHISPTIVMIYFTKSC
jgi:hypothetical protein